MSDIEKRPVLTKLTWRDILYAAEPAVTYTVLLQLIFFVAALAAGGQDIPKIMLQAAASAGCLVFFTWRAFQEKLTFRGRQRTWYRYPADFCYVTAVVMCGVACNVLISMTGLKDASAGYRHVTETFYGNALLVEILALCVIGPLVEELVYRGFVFQRLCRKAGPLVAVVISALVFGVMHFNLVQGIYAFVIGLALGYVACKTGSLVTAAAAHMMMNLVSVIWTETDWLAFLNQDGTGAYMLVAVCLALAVTFFSYGGQMVKNGEFF